MLEGTNDTFSWQPISQRDPIEISSYTPVHTRLALEVMKAIGVNGSKAIKASLEFPERGLTTMTVQLLVTEAEMRVALAAVAAIEATKQP